jgi:hypothetical protein
MSAETTITTSATLTCLNCGTAFQGNYCHSCGQKAGPPIPSTKEIAGDFFRSAFTPSGKVWESVWHLMSKPGEPTKAYFAGQRRRYVHPVRLYLLSVFIFAVAVGLNNTWREWTGQKSFEEATSSMFSRPDAKDEPAAAAGEKTATESKRAAVGKAVGQTMKETLPLWLTDIVKARAARMKDMTPEQAQAKAIRSLSRSYSLVFALLVPFLAAINWLLYLNRKVGYAGHFVFMLHGTAASCLMFLPAYALNLPVLYFAIVIVSSVWYVLAGRRAFDVSFFGALWRYVLLMIPGAFLTTVATFAFVTFAVLFG